MKRGDENMFMPEDDDSEEIMESIPKRYDLRLMKRFKEY